MSTISNSVDVFFHAASLSPALSLRLSDMERSHCMNLGDALVQVAIELNLQRLLAAGLIRLISPQHIQRQPEGEVSVDEDYSQEGLNDCAGCNRVRCLHLGPAAPSITPDDVKYALLRKKIQFGSIRRLGGGGFEVTADYNAELGRVLQAGGLQLHRGWWLKVRDGFATKPSKSYRGRAKCYLCESVDHIKIMCIRQRPRLATAFGG